MFSRRPVLSAMLGVICLGAICGSQRPVFGQGLEYVKANYTKYEYRIPMRDGTKLFTAVYVPKDADREYPILLSRTPYSCQPYGVDQYRANLGPSTHFAKAGYIIAYQDVRGRWSSEGEYVNVRPQLAEKHGPTDFDESTDTYDTIDFLIKNVRGHNGRVGLWGISYPGFYSAIGAVNAHPALKAISPQAPVCDWFAGDDWHHNGAFMLAHCFNFLSTFGRPRPEPIKKNPFQFDHGTPDGYDFFMNLGPLSGANAIHFKDNVPFWNEVLEHGTYDDFWKARNLRTQLKGIRPAVMTVGGWFDAENLFGALAVYRTIEATSPGTENVLVMGPWNHGGWASSDCRTLGHVAFNSPTGEFFREKIEFPFFEFHLKGEPKKGSENSPKDSAPKKEDSNERDSRFSKGPFRRSGSFGRSGSMNRSMSKGRSPRGRSFSSRSKFSRRQEDSSARPQRAESKKSPLPEAWVFETGTNVWRKFDSWPPKDLKRKSLHFRESGKLLEEPPTDEIGQDSYVSDPNKPVPFQDRIDHRMSADYMIGDQRFAARRPDVLVYQTDVLENDVTIAGPIDVRLFVSTTGTDSDWIVKIIDVYPPEYADPNPNPAGVHMGNFQQLVRGEVMRGKFRNSLEKPEPFEPHQPTAVDFTLPDTCHTFRTGHRIMVHVQSSWFPLVDRNPQKFVDIYHAKQSDFEKATQNVFRTKEMPSRIEVLVLPQ